MDALVDALGPLPEDPGDAGLRAELLFVATRLVLSLVPALLTYRVLLRDPAPDEQLAERLVDAVLLPLLALNNNP